MRFTAKTLYGLEGILADELKESGASGIQAVNRAVIFSGNLETLYRINYCSRFAISVLVSVNDFTITDKDDLYRKTLKTDWSAVMDADSTFSVVPVVNSVLFTHTGYPGLIVKDAIADHFRKRGGKRPSVNTADPDVVVNLHISHNNVNLSVDSSVVPLFKRGYRKVQGAAPLNEVLAAGIIKLSGWDGSAPLKDPMCGSGTIPIEAGLLACRIPPGKFRQFYGFTRWKNYNEDLFKRIKSESDKSICSMPVTVSGSDISELAVRQAAENIANAGLSGSIRIEVSDFCNSDVHEDRGFLIFNPPYGQRLKPDEIESLYDMIGTVLKHKFPGYRAWIITAGKELLKHVGLKPSVRKTLYNGSIECVLAGYELYEGSRKHRQD